MSAIRASGDDGDGIIVKTTEIKITIEPAPKAAAWVPDWAEEKKKKRKFGQGFVDFCREKGREVKGKLFGGKKG